MLGIDDIRVLSILLLVGTIGRFVMLAFFTRKRQELGSVKASKPTDFVLQKARAD